MCVPPSDIICIYIITIFCGIALFSPWAKRFFSCFLVHDTQHACRYITRYVWVSPHAGGACTGRRKALGRAGTRFRTKKPRELPNRTKFRGGIFFLFHYFTLLNVRHRSEANDTRSTLSTGCCSYLQHIRS